MRPIDIRPMKMAMRRQIKSWRASLSTQEKQAADRRIFRRVVGLREYRTAGQLLVYVSLPIEVDTLELIQRGLRDGKRVAVPRCVEGTRRMEFYYIRSLEDLEPGTYGVLEPVRERCELVRQFQRNGLCLVPALACDRRGFRLGYGAGYYDRFLSAYPGRRVGIVYDKNLVPRLWNGRYDVPLELVVTDRRLHICTSKVKGVKRLGAADAEERS